MSRKSPSWSCPAIFGQQICNNSLDRATWASRDSPWPFLLSRRKFKITLVSHFKKNWLFEIWMPENKSNIWLSQHWLNQNEKDWWKFYGKLFLIKAFEVLHGRCSVRFSLISIDTLDMLDTIQWIENLHICQSRRFRYWEPSLENPLSEIESEFQRTSTMISGECEVGAIDFVMQARLQINGHFFVVVLRFNAPLWATLT